MRSDPEAAERLERVIVELATQILRTDEHGNLVHDTPERLKMSARLAKLEAQAERQEQN